MKPKPEISEVFLRQFEPVLEKRPSRMAAMLAAGFETRVSRERFDEETRRLMTPQYSIECLRQIEIDRIKALLGRHLGVEYDSPLFREANAASNFELKRVRALSTEEGLQAAQLHQDRWQPFFKMFRLQYAKEVVRFSSSLSREVSDEELFEKASQNHHQGGVSYGKEDTLQKRIEVIRTLLDRELHPLGFQFDKKFSSIKSIVYCKPLCDSSGLFVSTERVSLNPKKANYDWHLGFCFGIHCLEDKWPDGWSNDGDKRWTLFLNNLLPYGVEIAPRSLPEIEAAMRFSLFGYSLIADEFESAMRAGLAEAAELFP